MAERNVQLIPQILNSEIEQGQTLHPVFSASGSTTDIDSDQLSRHHNANIFYRNQDYNHQQYHMIPTPHFVGAASSHHNSYMIPSSTGRISHRPLNHGPYARPYGISRWPLNAAPPAHMPFSSNYGVARSVSGGLFEGGSAGGQVYQDIMYNNNFAIPSPSIRHNHQPPATQGVRGFPYGFHPQLPMPSYRHSSGNNLHHHTINNSREDRDFTFRHQTHASSTRDLFYRPPQGAPQSAQGEIIELIRFIPSEEVAIMEFPTMQGEIDDMSHEELLALAEQNGHINTGLTDDTISEYLRTRTYEINQENNQICVICQAEYEENEKLGCLECGHEYHVDCIKQWLLLKNTCPLCKNQAFSLDNKE